MITIGENDIWATADWHLGHNNIRTKFIMRPFMSDDHMVDFILQRVMDRVPRGARLYHLGDMFWRTLPLETAIRVMDTLSVFQNFYIWGNHEELLKKHAVLRERFIWMEKYEMLRRDQQGRYPNIFLNHFAQRVWEKSGKGSWHLYGHSHDELPPKGLSFDVGVDTRPDFAPYSIAEIAAKMATREIDQENKELDQSKGGCVR